MYVFLSSYVSNWKIAWIKNTNQKDHLLFELSQSLKDLW